MGIESIIRKIGMFAAAGLASLAASCMPLRKQYVEPRLGLAVPMIEEQEEYDSSFMIGAAYGRSGRPNGIPKEKLGLEASLDYFKSSAEYIETSSFLLRGNATYPMGNTNPSMYLTGGLAFLFEFSDIYIPPPIDIHDEKSETTFGLEIGANMRFDAADIEDVSIRLSYIKLFSDNVKGMLVLTTGYNF